MRVILLNLIFIGLGTFCVQELTAQSCSDGSYQFSDIVSIFAGAGCNGCHGAAGGLNLSDYNNVIVGGNRGQGGCGPYPDALSFLIGKVDGSLSQGDFCGGAMPNGTPFGSAGMSASDIAEVQAWIDAGAPEFCPPPCNLTLSAATQNLTCIESEDGVIELFPMSGTGPYTYIWDNGFLTGAGTGTLIFGLEAGAYTVMLTDTDGCDAQASVILIEPAPIETIATDDLIGCGTTDGSIILSVLGGTPPYTYNWSNGSVTQNLTGLATGMYSVSIVDSNGCIVLATAIVSDDCDDCPAIMNITLDPIPPGPDPYHAAVSLSAEGRVMDNTADVGFKAGQIISLEAGFSVEPGAAYFYAEIENCLPFIQVQSSAKEKK